MTLLHELAKLLVVLHLYGLYGDNDTVVLSDDVPGTTVLVTGQYGFLHWGM